MIEMNGTNKNNKQEKSLFYKIARGFLMFLSGIIMFYFLLGIANYINSGPSITLLDDLTPEFVVQVILMGLGLFYLIVAWFRNISYGIVSIIFTFLYVIYSSLLINDFTIDFLPIAMASNAIGFVILGFIEKYRRKSEYNVYAEPIVNEYEGPDVFNFRV